MWKDYSASYLKNNRASSVFILAAAFIATLFLSLLCSLAFNVWNYEVEQIVLEEGGWQARITGPLDGQALAAIQNFANVERVTVRPDLSAGQAVTADLTFRNMRTVYRDVPLLLERLGLGPDAAAYHELLLSRYLVHDPQDGSPPLLLAFYLAVLLAASLSLVLIIHNAFAVSMNARVHQFGILSSVGATPGQIRTCLLQEAAALCAGPIALGCALGTLLSFGIMQMVNRVAADVPDRHEAVFRLHPLVLALALLASAFTVLFSAWLPARRLSRITPLEAIRSAGGLQLRKRRRSPLLSLLFGAEGELAGSALKAQKQALRTSTLSLTLSFLVFTVMLCFLTLSDISTGHTYFERYQDAWDVMATVPDARIEEFPLTQTLQDLPGVQSCVVYQKAQATVQLPAAALSGEVAARGGLEALAGLSPAGGVYAVRAPIVILDDASFLEYARQAGAAPGLYGSIVLNRIWDSAGSSFRYKEYVPYLSDGQAALLLQSGAQGGAAIELPVLACAQQPPVLREEYENYALVQFLSATQWKELAGRLERPGTGCTIRLLASGEKTPARLRALENALAQALSPHYPAESENRIQEKRTNDRMYRGYMLLTGAFCALLALIGIANVFCNTLGFLRQRRREFAQYLSVGMTPAQMKKLFAIEALVIAGRPLLVTLPLTVFSVGFMITASYLDPMEFLVRAPLAPILAFLAAIFASVALAYYLGGKKLLRSDLAGALRSDASL